MCFCISGVARSSSVSANRMETAAALPGISRFFRALFALCASCSAAARPKMELFCGFGAVLLGDPLSSGAVKLLLRAAAGFICFVLRPWIDFFPALISSPVAGQHRAITGHTLIRGFKILSSCITSDPFPCKGTKLCVQFNADVVPAVPLCRKPRCAAPINGSSTTPPAGQPARIQVSASFRGDRRQMPALVRHGVDKPHIALCSGRAKSYRL